MHLPTTDSPPSTPSSDWDPETRPTPEDLAQLRKQTPVAYTDQYGGYWSLMRHEDSVKMARDFKRFAAKAPFLEVPELNNTIPLTIDPPLHNVYRRPLNHYWRPEAMDHLEPTIRRIVLRHLHPLITTGGGDFARDVALPVPGHALAAFLNLDESAGDTFVSLVKRMEETEDLDDFNHLILTLFDEELRKALEARKAQPMDPSVDLLSGILALEVDGKAITEETVRGIGIQVISAGHDTTSRALSNMVYRLATMPDVQASIRADRTLIPVAIEEFLRLDPPLQQFGRKATVDVELHGRKISAGQRVAMNIQAGNRDETVFDRPDDVVLDRERNPHLTFSTGVHQCVGAPMARLELRVVLEKLLDLTRTIELDGNPVRVGHAVGNGYAHLPIKVTT